MATWMPDHGSTVSGMTNRYYLQTFLPIFMTQGK
jgi:hypothetical protein